MIKRVVEVSRAPAHIRVCQGQLDIVSSGVGASEKRTVPLEDLGILCVDEVATTYTHSALAGLVEAGATLVVCGRDHLPAGLLLPLSTHSEVARRLREQLDISQPRRKQLWQAIVRAKVRAQARVLEEAEARRTLERLVARVTSGDATNVEAQAARYYWRHWLGDGSRFRRDPDARDPGNAFLNYGYAILRAAVARALVSAGLQPALGIHHSHRANAFCLADDLVEPLRPFADERVRDLLRERVDEVGPEAKRQLLGMMTVTARVGDAVGPLWVGLSRYAASFARSLGSGQIALEVPAKATGPETADSPTEVDSAVAGD